VTQRPDTALGSALRYLAASERTEAELRSFLSKMGADEQTIGRIVDHCLSKRFLSDARVAERETELAKSRRFDGRLKVAAKLEKRGLDEESLDRLAASYTEADETQAARAWLRLKKFTDPAKAARSLASKGFSEDAAKSALSDTFPDVDF